MQVTPRHGRFELTQIPVWWVVGVLAAVIVAGPFEGNDYPAQVYHTVFAERLGEVFNLQWFAGHHVAGYGVLLAPVAAALGIGVTGIVSALVASWAFDRLVIGLPGRRLASWWFGLGTLVNLLVGRLTFAMGLALGLCALLALRRGHYPLALGLASATMLGSPVAGAFLALAVAAWTLDDVPDRLWRGVGLGAACFGPYVVLMRLFPSGGWFPYHAQSFLVGLGISVLLLVVVPKQHRVIRIGSALHIVAAVAAIVAADPDGRQHQPADDVLRRTDPRRRHPVRAPQAAGCSPCRCCTGSGARRSTPSSPHRPTPAARPSTTRHSSPRWTTSSSSTDRCASRSCRHCATGRSPRWRPRSRSPAAGGASSTWSTTRCSTTARSTPPRTASGSTARPCRTSRSPTASSTSPVSARRR